MKRRRRGCALRRRYGHAVHGVGYVDAKLDAAGRNWLVTHYVNGVPNVLFSKESRGSAIAKGQKAADNMGVPFLMGL